MTIKGNVGTLWYNGNLKNWESPVFIYLFYFCYVMTWYEWFRGTVWSYGNIKRIGEAMNLCECVNVWTHQAKGHSVNVWTYRVWNKVCTELSAVIRVTSRIRTSHLLSPSYICDLGVKQMWKSWGLWPAYERCEAYSCSVTFVRPMANLWYPGLWPFCMTVSMKQSAARN